MKTSQSGFRYHKMHSIHIAIYECKGLQAAGHDSDMEDEDEIMWEDEVPDGPAVIYKREGVQAKRGKPENDAGLLTRIFKKHVTISPLVLHGCFYECVKLAMIYSFNTATYVKQLKNMQRPQNIECEMQKLASRDLPHLVVEDGFPEDVPLDENFF